MSRTSQIAGASFEAWIDAQHTVALNRGLLYHVEHYEPHAKRIGGRLVYVKAGVSDYAGVLAQGRVLAVEAKSTQKKYLPRSAIRRRQAEHLEAVARAGGLALLLVEFRPGPGRRYSVPWLETPWTTLRTAPSVAEADILPYRIPDGACYLARFAEAGEVVARVGRRYPRE